MGYPGFFSEFLARVRVKIKFGPFSRKVGRKAGIRMSPSTEVGAVLPTPILSLEGAKIEGGQQGGCSDELQALIFDFRHGVEGAEDALIAYIEEQLGETIQEAYPDEWEQALSGERTTITIDLGADVLTLTLDAEAVEGGSGECDPELISLVDAYTLNPSEANLNALIFFVEEAEGQSIQTVLSPEWDLTVADGVPRTKAVLIAGCLVEFDIDATVVPARACADLPTYKMALTQNDFHLETLTTGATVIENDGGFQHYDILPSYDIHLEDPELVWLPSNSSGQVTGYILKTTTASGYQTTTPTRSPAGTGPFFRAGGEMEGRRHSAGCFGAYSGFL